MIRKIKMSDVDQWLDELDSESPKVPNIQHPEELQRLLEQLAVSEHSPDLQQGQFWRVYAQAHATEKENCYNFLVHIFPAINAVDSDCEGLRATLQGEDGICWLTRNKVDHRSQIWFKNVKPGCYHVIADHDQLYASSVSKRAAAATPPKDDLLVSYLEDRRIRVNFMRLKKSGKTELTMSTEAEEYVNSTVQFAVGEISGTLILKPVGDEGFCRGTCNLDLDFNDIHKYVPFYSVTRPEKNDK